MKELKNQPHRVIVGKVRRAVASCLFISAVVLGLLSTNHAQVQTCTPPPPNMVSWWPGDGNANDIQGSSNGTPLNGATFVPGKVDQAFSFDGVDNEISITHTSALDFGPNDSFTVDACLKPSTSVLGLGGQRFP